MIKAYKYLIHPTDEQKILFAKTFGCTRFIYNWALDLKIKHYEEFKDSQDPKEKNLSAKFQLGRLIPELKKAEKTKWLSEVPSMSLIYELDRLDIAYKNFFKRVKTGGTPGFPKFKNKFDKQSFTDKLFGIDFKNKKVNLPKIGWIDAVIHRDFSGKHKAFTVTKTPTGKYFISIIVDDGLAYPAKLEINNILGVDKGTHNIVTLSNGDTVENPKYFEKYQAKLAVLQKRLSKKVFGSSSYNVAKLKVAKCHEDISNARNNFIHNISKKLVELKYDTIGIENFDIANLVKGNKIPESSKKILDTGWGMLNTQLEYKSNEKGINIVKLDKFAKSNRTCVFCEHDNSQIKFWETEWFCQNCNEKNIKGKSSALLIKELIKQ
jgi:putative transposase